MPKYLVRVDRPPRDDDELWHFVRAVFGAEIPRTQVCTHHPQGLHGNTPFDAFADAYFARHPVSVWKASRGLGGKSYLLALLALTEMVTLGATVTILGGSGQQATRVHEAMTRSWAHPYAPTQLLVKEPTSIKTELTNGANATVLMASQTSARGPHPNRLRLDEIDEMPLPILDASLGQPMSSPTVSAQIVMSSTWHNAQGTMTEIYERANTKESYGLFEWCYHETLEGWLTEGEVERQRSIVTSLMWMVEYEGQQPSGGAVAILPEAVEMCYDKAFGEYAGDNGEYIEIEAPAFPPDETAPYCTGVDWAKENDWTVIETYRTDVHPWRRVAWERLGRMRWPTMVASLDARLERYGGVCCHDNTGLGDVIDDYITHDTQSFGIQLVGRQRQDIFSEYISAIENKDVWGTYIKWAYDEHARVNHGDLSGAGHPPDSFVAGALAWHARRYEKTSTWGFV